MPTEQLDPVAGADRTSPWLSGPVPAARPALKGEAVADVAVVGAGIVGLTAAVRLARLGAGVTVLEASRIGSGTTGHSTAKVTSAHGARLDLIARDAGQEALGAYVEASEDAIRWMREQPIECGWVDRDAVTYATGDASARKVVAAAKAAERAGLDAELTDSADTPERVTAALLVPGQAAFDPHAYLLGLADEAERAGATIHEDTRAVSVDDDVPCTVHCREGRVRAPRVLVATHFPMLDRGLFFARLKPERSYAIAFADGTEPSREMLYRVGDRTRSVLQVPASGGRLVLIAGEGHTAGRGPQAAPYRSLARTALDWYGAESASYRWSAQDPVPLWGLPHVGPLTPWSDRILTATGFAKWGLSTGTAAGIDLAHRASGEPAGHAFAGRWRSRATAVPRIATENAQIAWRFTRDKVSRPSRAPDALEPGDGGLCRHDGRTVAASRTPEGELLMLDPSCTHLGCRVAWNDADSTWDCPCHGSRFAADGRVIEGPAVRDLPPA